MVPALVNSSKMQATRLTVCYVIIIIIIIISVTKNSAHDGDAKEYEQVPD